MTREEREQALTEAIVEFCQAARDVAIMVNEMTMILEDLRRVTNRLNLDD